MPSLLPLRRTARSRHVLIGLAMWTAAGLAFALTPRTHVAAHRPPPDLEAMIPKQFGKWQLKQGIVPLINPALQSISDEAYDQTLARSYVNDQGELLMLSVVYTRAHTASAERIHLPEACYFAQGFRVGKMSKEVIEIGGMSLPVMKLVATQGHRVEPITYWAVIGDMAVRGKWEMHLAKWKHGLTGKIPPGLLIRVSTVSTNEAAAYHTEKQFVHDMLGAVPKEYHRVLMGATL